MPIVWSKTGLKNNRTETNQVGNLMHNGNFEENKWAYIITKRNLTNNDYQLYSLYILYNQKWELFYRLDKGENLM